jgi:peptidoglycan LD-endopeptidase CwlK
LNPYFVKGFAMKLEDIISAVQDKLGVQVDGRAGPQTWAAVYNKIVGPLPTAAGQDAREAVDTQSEKHIATLLPEVQALARALVHQSAQMGIQIKILSGLRTYAEQDALYAQGRNGDTRKKVTNARGGHSNHNFGIAFDVGVFEGSKYLTESAKYKAVGALGQQLGLEWGGNWKTIVDEPHFQLRPAWAHDMNDKTMLAQLRARVEGGQPVYA